MRPGRQNSGEDLRFYGENVHHHRSTLHRNGSALQGNDSRARKQLQNELGRGAMTEETSGAEEVLDIEFLHEIGSRMAAADPFHAVLERVVDFVSTMVMCDSCFVYVLEQDKLVLCA
jgi:hypothetical protein